MRVFAALPAPASLLRALDTALASVPVPGRLTARAQWHVTLSFAADWRSPSGDPDDPAALIAACEAADRGVGPVRLTGPGAFPTVRAARLLWVGFDPAPLVGLAAALGAVFAPEERRPFRAHMTIARLRRPTPAGDVLDALRAALPARDVVFDELVVYRSRLGRAGAQHEPLWRAPLA